VKPALLKAAIPPGIAAGLALAALALAAVPADAQQPGILDRTALTYRQASFVWMDRLHPLALRTFFPLAGIEFALSGILWMLNDKETLESIAGQFIRKFTFVSFWFAILFSWELWIPYLAEGFRYAGVTASGRTTLTPSEIVRIGSDLQVAIGSAASDWLSFNPFSGFTIQVAALLVLLAYVSAAVAISYTLVQLYLVTGAGVFFLGFAAFRGTAQWTDNYLNLLAYVGIKLMVLFLLVGLGTTIGAELVEVTAGVRWTDMAPAAEIFFVALLFLSLVLGLPVMIARHITQGHSFGLVNAIRAKDH
jgi:type IV secretion system protein TrbL